MGGVHICKVFVCICICTQRLYTCVKTLMRKWWLWIFLIWWSKELWQTDSWGIVPSCFEPECSRSKGAFPRLVWYPCHKTKPVHAVIMNQTSEEEKTKTFSTQNWATKSGPTWTNPMCFWEDSFTVGVKNAPSSSLRAKASQQVPVGQDFGLSDGWRLYLPVEPHLVCFARRVPKGCMFGPGKK